MTTRSDISIDGHVDVLRRMISVSSDVSALGLPMSSGLDDFANSLCARASEYFRTSIKATSVSSQVGEQPVIVPHSAEWSTAFRFSLGHESEILVLADQTLISTCVRWAVAGAISGNSPSETAGALIDRMLTTPFATIIAECISSLSAASQNEGDRTPKITSIVSDIKKLDCKNIGDTYCCTCIELEKDEEETSLGGICIISAPEIFVLESEKSLAEVALGSWRSRRGKMLAGLKLPLNAILARQEMTMDVLLQFKRNGILRLESARRDEVALESLQAECPFPVAKATLSSSGRQRFAIVT